MPSIAMVWLDSSRGRRIEFKGTVKCPYVCFGKSRDEGTGRPTRSDDDYNYAYRASCEGSTWF